MYISALSACLPLFPLRHQISLEMIGSNHVIAGNGTQDLWKSSQLDWFFWENIQSLAWIFLESLSLLYFYLDPLSTLLERCSGSMSLKAFWCLRCYWYMWWSGRMHGPILVFLYLLRLALCLSKCLVLEKVLWCACFGIFTREDCWDMCLSQ